MKRKDFIKTTAKALVATAFIGFPFKKSSANSDTASTHRVFSDEVEFTDNDGNKCYYVIEFWLPIIISEYDALIKIYNDCNLENYSVEDTTIIQSYKTILTEEDTNYYTFYKYELRSNNDLYFANDVHDLNDFEKFYTDLHQVYFSIDNKYVKLNSNSFMNYKQLSHVSDYNFKTHEYQEPDYSYSLDYDCFLTTACIMNLGLADDCYELETLRSFRDNYMLQNVYGKKLVKNYYEIGPKIVSAINKDKDKSNYYQFLYQHLVQKSIHLIETGNNELAMLYYENFTKELSKKLL